MHDGSETTLQQRAACRGAARRRAVRRVPDGGRRRSISASATAGSTPGRPSATGPTTTFADPKIGGMLRTSGSPERDLVRMLIMDERVEAFRPTVNLLKDEVAHRVSYVAATFDNQLRYHVVIGDEELTDPDLRELLRAARHACRAAGGRLLTWTPKRIRRAYPSLVARLRRVSDTRTVQE